MNQLQSPFRANSFMDRLYPKQYAMGHHGNSFTSFGVTGVVGGWKELGRETLGSASNTMTVSSLADKRYYMVLTSSLNVSSLTEFYYRLNADTGTNYSSRISVNGASDSIQTSRTSMLTFDGFEQIFEVAYFPNVSSKEKLMLGDLVSSATLGAGTAPTRVELTGKHAQTSNPINEIQNVNAAAGGYPTGSEIVVLEWDPADVHTDNFWEELASVNASGSSTNLSSGTITAKKYLWIQCYLKNTTSHTSDMTFNNDTTTYSYRISDNDGIDLTSINQSDIELFPATTTPIFVNMFIINNSAHEKLVTGYTINQNASGAGTAPNRREFAGKWDNDSSQITEIDMDSSSGNWDSVSIMKVWGSD